MIQLRLVVQVSTSPRHSLPRSFIPDCRCDRQPYLRRRSRDVRFAPIVFCDPGRTWSDSAGPSPRRRRSATRARQTYDNSTSESIGKAATTLEDKRSPHVTGRWSAAARSVPSEHQAKYRQVDGSPTVSCFRFSPPPARSIETGQPVGLSTGMNGGSFRRHKTGTQARSCS